MLSNRKACLLKKQINRTIMTRRPIVQHPKSKIQINNLYEAEPLEMKLRRKMKGGKVDEEEGDQKTWTIAYTEKKDGVKPEYDIRTDRFEVAREAMETIEKGIQLSYSDPNDTATEKPTEGNETDKTDETR